MPKPIRFDPRLSFMASTINPQPITNRFVGIKSMYEPVYLPDGLEEIPSYKEAGEVMLERLGPSPQRLISEPLQPQKLLSVTKPFPLPYGRPWPAPGLPTGSIPRVPTRASIGPERLTAPRYLDESKVTPAPRIRSYPIFGDEDEDGFEVAAAAPDYRRISLTTRNILPWYQAAPSMPMEPVSPIPRASTEYVPSLTEPIDQWYQDIPAAPGAPTVSEMVLPSPNEPITFVTMQMDNGTVAYVPLSPPSPEGRRLMISAPSSGTDTRYTKARAADGSTVSVAIGYPLPTGVIPIPDPNLVNVETTSGETYQIPSDVIATAVLTEEEKKENGLPGWLIPAGIGIALFMLLRDNKNGKKEQ